jgi:hypothetical protein
VSRLVAAILVIAAAAGPAAADDARLDDAQRAIDDIDHERARALVDDALGSGRLGPAELARAHRLAGQVRAALDDDAGARGHFVKWILLEPGAALPAGESPKITGPFAAAKAEADQLGAMTIDVQLTRLPGQLRIELAARDPLRMIARLRVRAGGDPVEEPGNRVVVDVGDDPPATVSVSVLDAHGNELVRRQLAVERAPDLTDRPVRRRTGYPAIVRWPTWTGVAVVAAGVGGWLAYRVGQAEDELASLNAAAADHTLAEAQAVADRGRRDARLANLGFGVAAVAAVAAVVTFVLEPGGGVEVAPSAGPDGGGITASRRF